VKLTANARAVLEHRYLVRDSAGALVEEPAQLFARVAGAIAAIDADHGASAGQVAETARRFHGAMERLEFLPNSPTLMNAGRPLGQLAACFVVPVADSTADIFDAVKWAAIIQKTGGGTGFSFSNLRPAGDRVMSTGGVASGPVSFLHVFDVATDSIKQGGTRRGANMGVLRVDHPDVLDFIAVKLDPGRMTNFNLSVALTDEFVSALRSGDRYFLRNPRSNEPVRALSAARVFDLICNAAWATGDPGVVFIDRMNDRNPTPERGRFEATNPCGEQPLLPFESCTLGSINLGRFVERPGQPDAAIDWSRLGDAVDLGVHFLDNVIDANRYPLPQIAEATRATRKIGLGVMGFADMLIDLGVPYDDDRALDLGRRLASFIEARSLEASAALAERRGAFAGYDRSRWATGELEGAPGPLRNATTTTVAPTGTISIIAGCSSGIEPLYAVAYERRVLDGQRLAEIHPGFVQRAESAGIWGPELERAVVERGRVRDLDGVPGELSGLFPCAHDVTPDRHVRIQAVWQAHSHAAVSKTVNLPNEASAGDVRDAYLLAYELGCKGVTVYRDGSKNEQVLAFGRSVRPAVDHSACPECGGDLVTTTGCSLCRSCGYSVCG
jgi:ribonucleoside-diphosphate reductase alpha chain